VRGRGALLNVLNLLLLKCIPYPRHRNSPYAPAVLFGGANAKLSGAKTALAFLASDGATG
jgi:hypothetical protein